MNTRRRTRTALTFAVAALAILGLAISSASAALLVYEPFDYADGWLTGQGGALGTTGTWTAYDDNGTNDWRIHQEGDTSGIAVAANDFNTFDGTVANLKTTGGYVGLPGPVDIGAAPGTDSANGNSLDGSIALAPAVTATFQSGTTTWYSYVAVRGWDRNPEAPNVMLCTDPSPKSSRAASLTNSGNGIGTGGGPTRNERTNFYPMFFVDGNVNGVNGVWDKNWRTDAFGPIADGEISWAATDSDGFGAVSIVVVKIEWDADPNNGQDIISLGRFLETEEVTEAAFDALIASKPNLTSLNWAGENKPDLDQSQFDTLNVAGIKFFVDEIRIGTKFLDIIGENSDENAPDVDAGNSWTTWSGEPVTLDATITDKAGTDWTNLTYTWTADPADGVVITPNAEDATVTVTKAAPTGDATKVTLTLAVASADKPEAGVVEAATTITVYDDACKMAEGLGTLTLDAGDMNGDCLTDLQDFAAMTVTWLSDYEATKPVAKPEA